MINDGNSKMGSGSNLRIPPPIVSLKQKLNLDLSSHNPNLKISNNTYSSSTKAQKKDLKKGKYVLTDSEIDGVLANENQLKLTKQASSHTYDIRDKHQVQNGLKQANLTSNTTDRFYMPSNQRLEVGLEEFPQGKAKFFERSNPVYRLDNNIAVMKDEERIDDKSLSPAHLQKTARTGERYISPQITQTISERRDDFQHNNLTAPNVNYLSPFNNTHTKNANNSSEVMRPPVQTRYHTVRYQSSSSSKPGISGISDAEKMNSKPTNIMNEQRNYLPFQISSNYNAESTHLEQIRLSSSRTHSNEQNRPFDNQPIYRHEDELRHQHQPHPTLQGSERPYMNSYHNNQLSQDLNAVMSQETKSKGFQSTSVDGLNIYSFQKVQKPIDSISPSRPSHNSTSGHYANEPTPEARPKNGRIERSDSFHQRSPLSNINITDRQSKPQNLYRMIGSHDDIRETKIGDDERSQDYSPAESRLRTRINELIWENSKLRKQKEEHSLRSTIKDEVKMKELEKEVGRARVQMEKKTVLLAESQRNLAIANGKISEMDKELIRLREVEKIYNRHFAQDNRHDTSNLQSLGLQKAITLDGASLIEKKLDEILKTQSYLTEVVKMAKESSGDNYPPLIEIMREIEQKVDRERSNLEELVREKEKMEGVIEGLRERLLEERKAMKKSETPRPVENTEERKALYEGQGKLPSFSINEKSESTERVNIHQAFNSMVMGEPANPQPAGGMQISNSRAFSNNLENPRTQGYNIHTMYGSMVESQMNHKPSLVEKKSTFEIKPTTIKTYGALNTLSSKEFSPVISAKQKNRIQERKEPSSPALLASDIVENPYSKRNESPELQHQFAGPFNLEPDPPSDRSEDNLGAVRIVSRFGTIVPGLKEAVSLRDTNSASNELKTMKEKMEELMEENRRLKEQQSSPGNTKQTKHPQDLTIKLNKIDSKEIDDDSKMNYRRLDYFGDRPSIPKANLNFVSIRDRDEKKETKPQHDLGTESPRRNTADFKDVASIYSMQPPQAQSPDVLFDLSNYVNSYNPQSKVTFMAPADDSSSLPQTTDDGRRISFQATRNMTPPDIDFESKMKFCITHHSENIVENDNQSDNGRKTEMDKLEVPSHKTSFGNKKYNQECVSSFYTGRISEHPESEERGSRVENSKQNEQTTPNLGSGKRAQRQFSFKESPHESIPPKDSTKNSSLERNKLENVVQEVSDMKNMIQREKEEREKIAGIVKLKDAEVKELQTQLKEFQNEIEIRSLSKMKKQIKVDEEEVKVLKKRLANLIDDGIDNRSDEEVCEDELDELDMESNRNSGTLIQKKPNHQTMNSSSERGSFYSQENRRYSSEKRSRSGRGSLPNPEADEIRMRYLRTKKEKNELMNKLKNFLERSTRSNKSTGRVTTEGEIEMVYQKHVRMTVENQN